MSKSIDRVFRIRYFSLIKFNSKPKEIQKQLYDSEKYFKTALRKAKITTDRRNTLGVRRTYIVAEEFITSSWQVIEFYPKQDEFDLQSKEREAKKLEKQDKWKEVYAKAEEYYLKNKSLNKKDQG